MKAIDEKEEKVVIRAVSHDEEGKKKVEKTQLNTHIDTIKYVEKKLMDKGVMRMDRHPVDGLGGIGKPPPKSGHGGKFTWEGPDDTTENELDAAPPAFDKDDPNYVDEEQEDSEVGGFVVGEVEVAKEAKEGVARVEVHPHLKIN